MCGTPCDLMRHKGADILARMPQFVSVLYIIPVAPSFHVPYGRMLVRKARVEAVDRVK